MRAKVLLCIALSSFQLTSRGAIATLHEFLFGTDGNAPACELLADNGWLYGCASAGGTNNSGTVFKLSTNGSAFIVLKTFAGTNGYSPEPLGGLVLSGGTLYGTTSSGTGAAGKGTIFKVNSDGSGFQVLHAFDSGRTPQAGLLLVGSTLLGTTYYGGPLDDGTLFKIDVNGSGYTEFKDFTNALNSSGIYPLGNLATDGTFIYGCTYLGGAHSSGVIYKTDTVNFTVIHDFGGLEAGGFPGYGVILKGGTLYGVAAGGVPLPGFGAGRGGIIFKVNTDGSGYAILHSFTGQPDGKTPEGKLELVGNTLYGVTSAGGTNGTGFGTLFKINTDGSQYAILHHFTNSLPGPRSPLTGVSFSGGALYGTTYLGGTNDGSTVYAMTIPAASSPPALQITNLNQQLLVSWINDGGNWTLQTSPDLSLPIWSDVPTNWTSGSSIGLSITNPAVPPTQFFRLK